MLLTDGEIVWDETKNDFDWQATTALTPALAGCFSEPPRYVDMRWARTEEQLDLTNGRFRDQVADLAAPMHGVAKDEIAGVHVRQHRRTLRHAYTAGIALVLLTVVSFSLATNLAIDKAELHKAYAQLKKANGDLNDVKKNLHILTGTLGYTEEDRRITLSQDILAVGDSEMFHASQLLLADVPHIHVNATYSRSFAQIFKVLQAYSARDLLPPRIIIHVDSADKITNDDFNNIMSVAGSKRTVFFVNLLDPGTVESTVNHTLDADVKQHPKNARLLNWYEFGRVHDDWFRSGVELSDSGARQYALFIRDRVTPIKPDPAFAEVPYVQIIEKVLGESTTGRGIVGPLVAKVEACKIDPAAASRDIRKVIDNRNSVLSQLVVAEPPDRATATFTTLLQEAMHSSITADTAYEAWVDSLNQSPSSSSSCLNGNPPHAATQADSTSSDLKREFVTAFDPFAERFGLRTWSESEI